MENILVILIVIFAFALIGRSYFRKFTRSPECGCGCSSCSSDSDCGSPQKRPPDRAEHQ